MARSCASPTARPASSTENRVVPERLREKLREAAARWPGASVEEKTFNIVVHYRQAPSRGDEIHAFIQSLVAGEDFEVLPARMAFEIRHRALNKGAAVDAFMAEKPFASRVPVFVGDDVTDEDGFRAAEALGGLAVDVRMVFARRACGCPGMARNIRVAAAGLAAGGTIYADSHNMLKLLAGRPRFTM